ncbi:MAG: prepilin peptidase [Spirochaetota bacterium]
MLVYLVLVGLSIASFIGSLSYRVARDIPIASPPSFCDACNRRLKPYDLIPVVSYLVLGGRCRFCGRRIPLKYLAVEIFLPLGYVFIYLLYGLTPGFFVYTYLFTILLYLALLDLEARFIGMPGILLVYAGGVMTLFLSARGVFLPPPVHYLYGFASGVILVGLSFVIVLFIKKKMSLGAGDFLVIPGVALYFGVEEVVRIMVVSSGAGVVTGVLLILTGKVKKDYKFPMLPYITCGIVVEILLFGGKM